MPIETPVPKNDPLMVAWLAYKATEDYVNTRKWALHEEHVDGSLWAAFASGWWAQEQQRKSEAGLGELKRLELYVYELKNRIVLLESKVTTLQLAK